MAEEIVRVIKVDTKNSGKSINDLRKDIKALRQELDKTEVGTEEFSVALKKLTQTQKEYNSVQQQVRDMSRTNQQDMVKFASFARNLGKSYSALNAAVGLFADKNEDVQKSMLKVQRTIQLIQGLDGLSGLVRDLPKVIAGFKSWIQALSPLDRLIDRIAKGIDGIDPATLKELNELNRGGGGAGGGSTTTTTAGAGMQYLPAQNEELKKATTTYYPALLQQEKDLLKVRKELEGQLEDYNKTIDGYKKLTADLTTSIVKGAQKAGVSMNDLINLMNKNKDNPTQLLQELKAIPGVMEEASKEFVKFGHQVDTDVQSMANTIADAKVRSEEAVTEIGKVNEKLAEVQSQIAIEEAGMTKFQKVLARTGVVGKTAFAMIKTALASIGIGILISLLVKAGEELMKLIRKANEWKRINDEVAKSTNQLSAKPLVVLRELSDAYKKLGDNAEAKKKFVVDYNDKIKETGISITDVKKAEDVFVNNTDKYVNAIMARARAQAAENTAVKIYEDYLNQRYELEQKANNPKFSTMEEAYWADRMAKLPEGSNSYYKAMEEKRAALLKIVQKTNKEIMELDEENDKKMNALLKTIADASREYAGFFTSTTTTTNGGGDDEWKKWLEQREKDLETLREANKAAMEVFMDDRTKELQAVAKKYDELIALAKKYGEDSTLLELARQREIQEIIDKYNQQALDKEKERIENQYELIQKEIERIRKMNDTSNLRDPRQQVFQTVYKGNGVMPFGIQKNWINVYQSKEDVENQYKAQIEYNNKVYELTKQRIEQENALLQKQLEIEGLDADKRLEIQRTLAENEMALSDAKMENEQANLEAYLEVQEKKKQALEGVLEVTSTTLAAMASIFKTEAQIHQTESQDLTKSQEEREKAAKKMEEAMIAYKAFAITQAIVDTWKSANEAYAAMASIPYVGPALGIAASAAAVISGMANVRAIMSESMSSSSQSASVTAPSAMTAPPIEYTRNLVGDKELDEINQPIRCYVLESDISKTQNKVKVTEQNATF